MKNNTKLIEISIRDFLNIIEKNEYDALLDLYIIIIGLVEEVGNKTITIVDPNNTFMKLFLISNDKEIIDEVKEKIKQGKKHIRAILHINITEDGKPLLILDKVHVLENFNSKIYMKLLQLEREFFGDKNG